MVFLFLFNYYNKADKYNIKQLDDIVKKTIESR